MHFQDDSLSNYICVIFETTCQNLQMQQTFGLSWKHDAFVLPPSPMIIPTVKSLQVIVISAYHETKIFPKSHHTAWLHSAFPTIHNEIRPGLFNLWINLFPFSRIYYSNGLVKQLIENQIFNF